MALQALLGLFLLFATSGFAALHTHHEVPGGDGVSITAADHPGHSESGEQLDPQDCRLCDFNRRGLAEVAMLPAPSVAVAIDRAPNGLPSTTLLDPRDHDLARQAPRAPPVLS